MWYRQQKQKLHLDSEYRRRWEIFTLDDGTIEDSRVKNWRDVEWEKVKEIQVNIEGKTHSLSGEGKENFKGFLNFRYYQRLAELGDNRKFKGHKIIQWWIIGWTDGKDCFLQSFDFYTGDKVKEWTMPIEAVKGHIHPRLGLK